jgi:branched-subunit amino acid aminotransferase/4-amino-4-deoxychorismate lyase
LRIVVLNGRVVDPAAACLSVDDPAVRFGEGLLETMRAEKGAVALLGRHLDRMMRSAAELGLRGFPGRVAIERSVEAALAAAGPGALRVRVTASSHPTVLVDVTPIDTPAEDALGIRAISLRGSWAPDNHLAEHKTLARAGFRHADRLAEAAGARTALLLDDAGRLGEATIANAFVVAGGALRTAPVRGLLPGVTRTLVMEGESVIEEACEESLWRSADEIFLTSGVTGVLPVVEVDGTPVGGGRLGPITARVEATLSAAMGRQ